MGSFLWRVSSAVLCTLLCTMYSAAHCCVCRCGCWLRNLRYSPLSPPPQATCLLLVFLTIPLYLPFSYYQSPNALVFLIIPQYPCLTINCPMHFSWGLPQTVKIQNRAVWLYRSRLDLRLELSDNRMVSLDSGDGSLSSPDCPVVCRGAFLTNKHRTQSMDGLKVGRQGLQPSLKWSLQDK